MYAFMHCDNLRSTGLEHNSTVLNVGDYAFYYCTNLEDTGLASNSSVLKIKDYAFGHCEKLKSFVIRGDFIPVFGKNVFSNVADDFAVYYPVMVTNGSIRKVSNGKRMENSVTNGASVTIRSDDAPAGMEFQEWTVDRGNIVLTPANSETATFTMIEDAVKVSATYKELTYALSIQTEDGGTVTGTASGQYAAGTPITLKAIPNNNYKFDGWTATGIDLTNEQKNNAELSFAMPAENVKLTATFEREPNPHIYTFDSDWKFDAEYHWHECTAGDGARSDEAAHTASDWIIDQPAKETETGSRHRNAPSAAMRWRRKLSRLWFNPHMGKFGRRRELDARLSGRRLELRQGLFGNDTERRHLYLQGPQSGQGHGDLYRGRRAVYGEHHHQPLHHPADRRHLEPAAIPAAGDGGPCGLLRPSGIWKEK